MQYFPRGSLTRTLVSRPSEIVQFEMDIVYIFYFCIGNEKQNMTIVWAY